MSAAWGFFAVYAYTAILLSGSRGGQVAVLVGLAACVILTSKNRLRRDEGAVKIWLTHPVTGSGLGSSRRLEPGMGQ